jgi:fermentation-respiration switch protein FrsA (DUF1100 family)
MKHLITTLTLMATSFSTFAKSNDEWDKTFPKSEKVEHQKVTFKNRYGITLSADLYQPKDRGDKRLAAIAVSGPFGAVKEQSSYRLAGYQYRGFQRGRGFSRIAGFR